jgi:YSIRK-targeted surface antigen transcriptional regulator
MVMDPSYVANAIANLSGIPARVYEGNKPIVFYSPIALEADPFVPYEWALGESKNHVSFFVTPQFFYYGIVRHEAQSLVIGPSSQLSLTKQERLTEAFLAGLRGEKAEAFATALIYIVSMPLVSFAEMLCMVNYVWNEETLTSKDVLIQENEQKGFQEALEKARLKENFAEAPAQSDQGIHNTFDLERKIGRYITEGDWPSLESLFAQAVPARAGRLSVEQLRQEKNVFVVATTIASRAAVKGGLGVEEAMRLSDAYIQRSELLSSSEEIHNLQYNMIRNYAEKVHEIRGGAAYSKLVADVKNYVRTHLSKSIKIEEIAQEACYSRSHLAERFRKETGMTISAWVQKEKIEEAKRLLAYTKESIASVSDFLGYSSQSHFQNVFKKVVGMTPRQFRSRNGNPF